MLSIHKRWRADYNKKEALWKRSVSISHNIFCSCPDYRLHFTKKCLSTGDGGAGLDDVVSGAEGISFTTDSDHGGEGATGGTAEGHVKQR